MNRLIFLLGTCLLVTANVRATDYYVNAGAADDTGDGRSPQTAKKYLASVASLAQSPGDVIHAAPSCDYNKGTSSYNSRISVASGVTLVADDYEKGVETFITGSYEPGNNIRCVTLNGDAQVRGFVLRNGCATNSATSYGGGVYMRNATEKCLVADCLITNCLAARGGAVSGDGAVVRCRMFDNDATSATGKTGNSGSYFNCIMNPRGSGYDIYAPKVAFNCTFGTASSGLRSASWKGDDAPIVRNCLFLKAGDINARMRFYNCYSLTALPTSESYVDSTCKTVNWTSLDLIETILAPRSGSVLIGKGDYDSYDAAYPKAADDRPDLDVYRSPRLRAGALDVGAAAFCRRDWYVDVSCGDDGNDGRLPGSAHAAKTLAGFFSQKSAGSNDVVHVAPGDYREEYALVGKQRCRVSVPDGVTLLADGFRTGAETFITGESATTGADEYGGGEDAVRCVNLTGGAKLIGFVVRNGRVISGASGAGVNVVSANEESLIADCVISNCVAKRGGGTHASYWSVRTRYVGNRSTESIGAAADGGGRFVNCFFDWNVGGYDLYQCKQVVNCTFGRNTAGGPRSATTDLENACLVVNCLFLCQAREGMRYYNCQFAGGFVKGAKEKSFVDDKTCLDVTPESADCSDDGAIGSASTAIDKGDRSYYEANYPSGLEDVGAGADITGAGQRVYNAKIDVGAYEFDWRGRIAAKLSPRPITVEWAAPDVAEDGAGIAVNEGADLVVSVIETEMREWKVGVLLVGGGALSVWRGGNLLVTVTESASRCSLPLAEGVNDLTFRYAGAGKAVVSALNRMSGLVLIFR